MTLLAFFKSLSKTQMFFKTFKTYLFATRYKIFTSVANVSTVAYEVVNIESITPLVTKITCFTVFDRT